MDKVYDFNWIVQEIDASIIFMLVKDNKIIGGYQVSDILTGDMDDVAVKFANIDDLNNFINHAVVRFCDVKNRFNIVDIPIRRLKILYENSNKLGLNTGTKRISPSELDSFLVLDEKSVGDEYLIQAINFGKISEELEKIITIASEYSNMGMQERFDALGSINLANYQVEKKANLK